MVVHPLCKCLLELQAFSWCRHWFGKNKIMWIWNPLEYFWLLTFSSGKCECLLVFLTGSINCWLGLFTQISCEANHVEILLDVVHNLDLQECLKINLIFLSAGTKTKTVFLICPFDFYNQYLSSVIHDLVAELGLGNVLSELLDSGAFWWWTISVNDLKKTQKIPLSVTTLAERF